MPYAGALTGLLAGAFVALTIGGAALGRPEGFSIARTFSLLPLLAGFGLLYDVTRARYPGFWRSHDPSRLWMSWLFKTTIYWTATFPVARLLQDLATYWEVSRRFPDGGLSDLFPYLTSPATFLGFLVFQALFGTGFGMVFTYLYRRLHRPS